MARLPEAVREFNAIPRDHDPDRGCDSSDWREMAEDAAHAEWMEEQNLMRTMDVREAA
jgi:hypothetical protein